MSRDVSKAKLDDIHDILRLVTVSVEEDQINTPTCSPGVFIRQYLLLLFLYSPTVGCHILLWTSIVVIYFFAKQLPDQFLVFVENQIRFHSCFKTFFVSTFLASASVGKRHDTNALVFASKSGISRFLEKKVLRACFQDCCFQIRFSSLP